MNDEWLRTLVYYLSSNAEVEEIEYDVEMQAFNKNDLVAIRAYVEEVRGRYDDSVSIRNVNHIWFPKTLQRKCILRREHPIDVRAREIEEALWSNDKLI